MKAVSLFLLVFYSFGAFCLPKGDFAMIIHLPEMYQHCKSTEDKDMTALDFVTDHLLNIDGLFDKHANGDEQKPHSPIESQFHAQGQVVFIASTVFSITPSPIIDIKPEINADQLHSADYISGIFRPPIV